MQRARDLGRRVRGRASVRGARRRADAAAPPPRRPAGGAGGRAFPQRSLSGPRRRRQFAVGVATLGLLAAAAEQGPTLIVVDDLQWVDSASRDALSFAARRLSSIPDRPRRRTAGGCEAHCRALERRAGRPARARGRCRGALRGHAGDRAAGRRTRLLDAARGNPLALVELPRLLTQGQLRRHGGARRADRDRERARAGVRRAARAALRRRSSSRGRRSRRQSGSAGVVLRRARLARPGRTRRCGEVEALGLLRIDANAVEFRHPLVRSAAYHGADSAERRLVHAALAAADENPDRSAWHLAAAALGPEESLASKLEEAGRAGSGERRFRRGRGGPGARCVVDPRPPRTRNAPPGGGVRVGRAGRPRAKRGSSPRRRRQ